MIANLTCPYCLGNQHPENNVLIFCRVCKGSGLVSYSTRERWRASLPLNFKRMPNDKGSNDILF